MKSLQHSCTHKRFASQCPTFAKLLTCLLLLAMSAVTNNLHAQTYTDTYPYVFTSNEYS